MQVLKESVLLVNVSAGHGQALREMRKERSDLVGRMIAQNLSEVIADREMMKGVKNMTFDFFKP